MPVVVKVESSHNAACLTFIHKFETNDIDYTVFYKRKFYQTRTLKVRHDNGVYIDKLCQELLKLYDIPDHKVSLINHDDENTCTLEYTIKEEFVSAYTVSDVYRNRPDSEYIHVLLRVCQWVEKICERECKSIEYYTLGIYDDLVERKRFTFN